MSTQLPHPPGSTDTDSPPGDRPHWLQRFMDNPWLLLVLGIVIPFLSYTVWGWIELATLPKAPLP